MQKSIFIEGANSTVFIEGLLLKNNDSKNIIELVASIKKLETASLHIVIAFSKKTWDLVQPKWSPKELEPFKTVNGVANYSMPATQTDIFIWAHSNSIGKLFDLKKEIQEKAKGIFNITVMQDGFQYHDSRDLMGFVDGSANPKEDERMKAALIPKGEVGEKGSYVFAQKWKHDLSAFNDIPEHVQEKIIGRTKKESIELEGEDMPKNSHVSRTDVKLDGEAMKIYRRSYPYGDIINNGLYFLAFACSIKRIDIQLRSMVGDTEDKIHDRLMEFSAPLTGSYFFAPSDTDLRTIIG